MSTRQPEVRTALPRAPPLSKEGQSALVGVGEHFRGAGLWAGPGQTSCRARSPLPSRTPGLGVARARCLGDPWRPAHGAWVCMPPTPHPAHASRAQAGTPERWVRVTLKQSCFSAAPGPRSQDSKLEEARGARGRYVLPFQAPFSGPMSALVS